MPLVTDYQHVMDTYREAAARGVVLPAFCTEDRETLEAILASALELAREIGVEDLPVVPAWTGRYPPCPQAARIAACGDPLLGTRLMLSDLEVFCSPGSPYARLRVMPHLDHAFPWQDDDMLLGLTDRFASVMCDASLKPLDENIRLTADYVERVKGKVVVEGAVDELTESGTGEAKNEPTTVEQAARFMSQTGVDLIVPNVGTEHRSTTGGARYMGDRAREISAAVGHVLCLHGTSSLRQEDLGGLSTDGILKANVFTTLAVAGGQAVARRVLEELGGILPEAELQGLERDGVLGEAARRDAEGTRLSALVNAGRRDAWFGAVRERCREFLTGLGYERLA